VIQLAIKLEHEKNEDSITSDTSSKSARHRIVGRKRVVQ